MGVIDPKTEGSARPDIYVRQEAEKLLGDEEFNMKTDFLEFAKEKLYVGGISKSST